MLMQGWPGFVALVGLIRTAAEIMPVSNDAKKAFVVSVSGILSYWFHLDALGLVGLHIQAGTAYAGTAWFVLNSALIALSTFVGHDVLDQIKGGS